MARTEQTCRFTYMVTTSASNRVVQSDLSPEVFLREYQLLRAKINSLGVWMENATIWESGDGETAWNPIYGSSRSEASFFPEFDVRWGMKEGENYYNAFGRRAIRLYIVASQMARHADQSERELLLHYMRSLDRIAADSLNDELKKHFHHLVKGDSVTKTGMDILNAESTVARRRMTLRIWIALGIHCDERFRRSAERLMERYSIPIYYTRADENGKIESNLEDDANEWDGIVEFIENLLHEKRVGE